MSGNHHKRHVGIVVAAVGISAVLVVCAFIAAGSATTSALRRIELGNRYLNELDYEQAIAAFEDALDIDPKNEHALQGLMEAACQSGDYEKLSAAYDFFADLQGETSAQILEQMEAQLEQITREQTYNRVAALVEDADYAGAGEYITSLADADEELVRLKAQLLLKRAEIEWKNGNYEASFALLQEALGYPEVSDQAKNDLLRVTENYVIECMNHQDYGNALEKIEYLQQVRNDQSLDDYLTLILERMETDTRLQEMIEALNQAFEADDVKQITALMQQDEFKESGKQIRTVFYSQSLKNSAVPEGMGTAIYVYDGNLYVYYGSFSDGVRSGRGRWYCSDEKDRLVKYDLTWVNDLPNGEGKEEVYENFSIFGYGGVLLETRTSHNTYSFQTVNGVMEGEVKSHGRVTGLYSYDLVFHLKNGYASRIEPGEYPAAISIYMSYPRPLAAWASRTDGGHVWNNWSPSRWEIAGIRPPAGNAAVREIKLKPTD